MTLDDVTTVQASSTVDLLLGEHAARLPMTEVPRIIEETVFG